MIKTTLEQFKTEKQKENTSRLTLDQFKIKSSENSNSEELEKLTGGTMASCHCANQHSNDPGIRAMDAVYHWLFD